MSVAFDELCALLMEVGARVTFDPGRSIAHPCTFCANPNGPHALVRIGRYDNGNDLTRPVCDGCAPIAEALAKIARPAVDLETVICAAIRLPDGRVIRGHSHDDCKRVAKAKVEKSGATWRAPMCRDQGFVSSRNRYVDREEGLRLQLAAGIPSERERGYHVRELFSEDLYR